MRYVCLVLLLAACSTPVTTMNNGSSVVKCGGDNSASMLFGYAGYSYQRDQDWKCVRNYNAQGYNIVEK